MNICEGPACFNQYLVSMLSMLRPPTHQLIDTSLPHQNRSEKTAVRHASTRYVAMIPRKMRILGSVTGTILA